MSTRDWIEVTASMIGGAGIGAALMYLFDPDLGDKRRDHLADTAGDTASTAGETLGSAWHSTADTVSDAARSTGKQASRWASAASKAARSYWGDASDAVADSAHGYWKSARKSASNAGDSAGGWLSDAGSSARRFAGRNLPEREHHSALGLTAGAVGALALGAGIMFILDPAQGRRRRALMRDKAYSAARQSGDYAQRTSRHLANKASGLAHDAASMAGRAKDSLAGATGSETQSVSATSGTTKTF